MGLQNPVVAYIAESNQEARSLVSLLNAIGIEAYASEDNATFGEGILGSTNHRPRVFIDESDSKTAAEHLGKFTAEQKQKREEVAGGEPVSSECEECGVESVFPPEQNGTVQYCPKCNAMMDVGEFEWPDD